MNNINTETNIKYNDYEMNNLVYEKALEIDNRTYFQYYISLIKRKELIIFIFYTNDDYNSRKIKISLLLFSFSLYYTVNCLFFNDETMHQIYQDKGQFNFIYQLPKIIYSTITSSVINVIINYLSLSEKNILKIKNNNENTQKVIKCLNFRFILFYILNYVFLIFFLVLFVEFLCCIY